MVLARSDNSSLHHRGRLELALRLYAMASIRMAIAIGPVYKQVL